MKKIIILSIGLILTACSDNNITTDRNEIENISAEKNHPVEVKEKRPLYGISPVIPNFMAVAPELFQELYDTGKMTVIDVRTPEEIAQGKIFDEALEINFYDSDFKEKISELDRNKKYLIYCRSGGRSGKTLQIFDELGFQEAYDLAGGNIRWQKKQKAKSEKKLEQSKITGKERIIIIDAEKYKFSTTEIRVKKDEKVVLKINNLDTTHGIRIPLLQQQDNEKILLDTSKAGVFHFTCNNLCGAGHLNMEGRIIIE